jgi:hypothetical protein
MQDRSPDNWIGKDLSRITGAANLLRSGSILINERNVQPVVYAADNITR